MILFVRLEMLLQVTQTRTQQGNLYFWRPGVGFVALICVENLPPCFNRQCHSRGDAPCLLLISFGYGYSLAQGKPRGFGCVRQRTSSQPGRLRETQDLLQRRVESIPAAARCKRTQPGMP